MEQDTKGLAERISFAESWLARARQQVEAGHHERGMLTLLLAAAEVRLAREAGRPGARRNPDRHTLAGWIAAGMVALSAVTLVSLVVPRTVGPTGLHSGQAPPVVVLSKGAGARLNSVQVPPQSAEKTVTKTIIVRVPVKVMEGAVRQMVPAAGANSQVVKPVPISPSAYPSAPAAAASSTAPQPALLSEADVIELVLAAERSLRRSVNH